MGSYDAHVCLGGCWYILCAAFYLMIILSLQFSLTISVAFLCWLQYPIKISGSTSGPINKTHYYNKIHYYSILFFTVIISYYYCYCDRYYYYNTYIVGYIQYCYRKLYYLWMCLNIRYPIPSTG